MSGDRLPNVERAIVTEKKIVGYLLADTHPDGMSKAQFFRGLGFTADRWQVLAAALRHHATANPMVDKVQTRFGQEIVIEGILVTPVGRTPVVRAVWIVEKGTSAPRLVTAYPAKRRQHDPRA